MRAADKQGSPATCGCPNTGSETVFVEGRGAVRTGFDHATGTIQGGVPAVTVEGHPISVVGDPITPHLHDTRHRNGPKTAHPAETVMIGEGSGRRPAPAPPEGLSRDGRALHAQESATTGAIAAARMIVQDRRGVVVSEQDLARQAARIVTTDAAGRSTALFDPGRGTYMEGMASYLRLLGVPASSVPAPASITPDFLRQATAGGTQPIVISRSAGAESQVVVVDGLDAQGNVRLRDPSARGEAGFRSVPLSELGHDGSSITVVGAAPSGQVDPLRASFRDP